MSWRTARGFCWDRAVRMLSERPIRTLLGVIVAALALALVVGAFVLTQSLMPVIGRLAVAEATAFVAAGAGSSDVKALSATLEAIDGVARVKLLSREQAWTDLQRRGREGQTFGEIRPNPLPDALVVYFKPYASPALVATTVATMSKQPRVEAVQADLEWYRRLILLLHAAAWLVGPVSVIVSLLVFVVVFGVVRRFAVVDPAELRLLDQIGAEPDFMRRPFVYAGAILLGLAAAGSLGLVAVGRHFASPGLMELGGAFGVTIRLDYPPGPLLIAFVAACLLLGAGLGYGLGGRQIARARGLR
jgi:cell division transport system permease protein